MENKIYQNPFWINELSRIIEEINQKKGRSPPQDHTNEKGTNTS